MEHARTLHVMGVALRPGHARIEARGAHAATSSSARRTSTSVTRRR
jgi:hypothetical protein